MVYVVIEGPDGSGKSTQAARLVESLRRSGRDVAHVREPGSTALGEHLRRVLLDPDSGDLDPLTEALLFSAARHELVRREIVPALARGTDVVAERSFVSTFVYQCLAPLDETRRAPLPLLRAVTERIHDRAWPDRVFVLDLDADAGARRLGQPAELDRIERRSDVYRERVRTAFVELARPDGWLQEWLSSRAGGERALCLVDGSRDADAVHAELAELSERLLARGGGS